MINPVAFTQELIRCASVTPEDAGVLQLLQNQLERIGFTVWRQVFEAKGTPPVENLYARYGTASPNFCFAGHLDVVPVGDAAAWRYPPFGAEIHDGFLYGRGAEDMKGAIACFVAAAERVITSGELQGSVSLLITLDEEGPATNGTRKMLKWLEEKGEKLDFCLVGEPTNPQNLGEMAKIGRRGSLNCHLTVLGKQGHVAYPELAENPIPRLLAILSELNETPLDEGTPYFPPSNLEITSVDVGNPATNVIPAKASARFNIRFNDSRPVKDVKMWIQHVCEHHDGQFDLELRLSGEAFHTPPNAVTALLQQAAEEVTGLRLELSTTGGTSDARFIKDYCPVIEFGTTGRTAHHVDENVAVETLVQLTEIYARVLARYGVLSL
jgi:succinyl-diaminopimelate desuccinylase